MGIVVELPDEDMIAGLDGEALDGLVWELERARRRVEAAIVAVTDRCERTGRFLDGGHRSVTGWLLATTNCSPGEAAMRRKTARMVRDLGVVGGEFAVGRVGVAQVHELARLRANPRCGDRLAGSERVLLDAARELEFTATTPPAPPTAPSPSPDPTAPPSNPPTPPEREPPASEWVECVNSGLAAGARPESALPSVS